ncbi:MAG: HAMP domain-containing sensor histidine kinase [Bacteroidales bacterium]|nr:HAMP domain-containing sensor histidine kinase [Bacteroidales bacterium]
MKLIYKITVRLLIILFVLLAAWAVFFYFTAKNEMKEEVQEAVENYSEYVLEHSSSPEEALANLQNENVIYRVEIDNEDVGESIIQSIIILYLALLLSILIINIIVYYRSMRPLYGLLKWLDNYVIGGENAELKNDTNIKEFYKLNEAVKRQTERTEKAFSEQKQFIGNASHEMQTPIAVCRNRLEMLMEGENLTEEQLGEIYKIQHTLTHIVKLNKTLLFLTKIDNGQFPDTQEVKIGVLVDGLVDDFQEAFSYKNITVSVDKKDEFVVRMNETLALALVSNLLKNAFVHNEEGGEIDVCIDKSAIEIKNAGGDRSLDQEKIFCRFYQGAKKEGSTGLGLAIIDAICKMYKLQVSYSFDKGKHVFCVMRGV